MTTEKQVIQIQLLGDMDESVNQDALDQLTRQLLTEISALENQQAQLKQQSDLLEGTKMVEFALAANVVIELIPHVVPPLMNLFTGWVKNRRGRENVSLNMRVGNQNITIGSKMSDNEIASKARLANSYLEDSKIQGKRYALVIGNSQYEDKNLTKLQAPDADVNAFSQLLADPQVGGFDEVIVLLNKTVSHVKQAIELFFKNKSRKDMLLLYFTGHGVKGDRNNLYLAVKDTKREVLRSTGISAKFISEMMDICFSQRKVFILDSCYSGAFVQGVKSSDVIGQKVNAVSAFTGNGFGQVVITASDSMQYAWEGDKIIGDTQHSLFTHYLIEGLKTGKADVDNDGKISLPELYQYAYEHVIPHQTPSITLTELQGKLIIANNPSLTIQPAELPDEIVKAINSSIRWQREGVIIELRRLLGSSDPSMVLAAENALEILVGDDSRRVSSMAFEAYSVRKRNNATIVSDREEEIVESPIRKTVSMPIESSSQTQKQMQIEQQLLHKHRKLFLALKSDITHNRRIAASKLGKLGDASVVPFLVKAYDDPDPFVRRNIIIALNRISSPTASEFLTSLPDSEKDLLMDIKKTNALLRERAKKSR